MEYIFGTRGGTEVLKTKGPVHTNLTGFQEIEQKYPDQTVTDHFRVVRRYDSGEDGAGNCYDWYIIANHYRMADRTQALRDAEARNAANIDYLSMMSGIDLPGEESSDG